MMKFMSIRQKFITNVMGMMAVIFLVVLVVITGMNVASAQKNLKKSEESVKNSLLARGRILVRNNSIALRMPASENGFSAVQQLVSKTVSGDEDIVRGIYMDADRRPWVNASSANVEGAPEGFDALSDSVDLWAAECKTDTVKVKSFVSKDLEASGSELLEFVAPVMDEDANILGHIRYAFSTASMKKALAETRADAATARNVMIGALVAIMLAALSAAYFLVKSLATKITKPIASLVQSAKVISQGDYSMDVKSESNDEIGKLAVDFDEMRKTIKKYTEHLQDLIDEKMQQVKDILNNIDQGLFTINFDGTVNEEYSARANEILKVGDVSTHNVYELLRLEENSKHAFDTWVELIRKKHDKQRWNKLEKLSPVRDMEFAASGDDRLEYVSVSYQKIYDKEGNLSKLMVLTLDETEKREKERMMKDERIRHENEMKTILGIANTPEDDLVTFIEDSETRLTRIKNEVEKHLEGVRKQRELHPEQEFVYDVSMDDVDAMYRDIHTIKGNGGSYGFDLLTEFAHRAEDALEELKTPFASRRDDNLGAIESNLVEMQKLMLEIRSKMSLIYGDEEAVLVRVSEENVEYLQNLANSIAESYRHNDVVSELQKVAEMLSWKPLKTLARKFQKIASTSADKLGKTIEFKYAHEARLYPERVLSELDEVLLHVIRNAVDHGIESDEVRAELLKPVGQIIMGVEFDQDKRVITIQDNGKGIDPEIIAQKAVEKGIITASEVDAMTISDKTNLIFANGFSTASEVSTISGRGVGMDIVKAKIEELHGVIEIASTVGVGTQFTITMPV